jgi:Resolvase, N terminal domain
MAHNHSPMFPSRPIKSRGGKVRVLQKLVPAAEYIRLSDETQKDSIANQKAAIREYAARRGFFMLTDIEKTFGL